ncbi:hypothetical protein C486_03904 [Natrinema gari JCM 14663]|uniref:Uncharacterized protein n=1 Tax=Natrinema gari JCM 14663 TaxID=1230459 RepID=L9Z933_9EURY|nr:hypothetical protein C486_03904 [Natrinema gari JCM 14663]
MADDQVDLDIDEPVIRGIALGLDCGLDDEVLARSNRRVRSGDETVRNAVTDGRSVRPTAASPACVSKGFFGPAGCILTNGARG